ncbi:DUF1642 domain-containing protein [Streptococcus sp. S2(2023)]|uniref:DUF1642 domain-containing protein n=1 Tax=Streptococcus gingivalis TaxID=3111861 RepID=A0ABU6B9U5_9STRE|nr:DUF1642 domain-containing protein [Streptococcus sp. S2(2023)]MEB3520615.1 DUF1642 domain-containing protein [Streptococcus sp. S2(2023)]
MNKQELIERIINLPYEAGVVTDTLKINRAGLINLIDQFDEPQKVQVPQIVADYIKYTKDADWDLQEAMDDVAYEDNKDLRKWFNNNIETFARAWLDGYEIEKEKRYYVRFKWIEESYSYLTLIKHLNAWTLSSIKLDKKFRTEHTKKQLEEAGFGWVFDCPGIEIEEVEG